MNRFIALIGVVALFAWAGAAQASPNFGNNCAGCHGAVTGRATVKSSTTTDASVPAVPAGLPVFNAHPGETISLGLTVTNGGSVGEQYAVAMRGLTTPTTIAGLVTTTDRLTFTPAAVGWSANGSGTSSYAYIGGFSWSGTNTDYAYTMTLGAAVPADYYRVTLVTAGSDVSGNTQWSQSFPVVIHVTPVPEPASLALIGLPVGLLLMRRRKLARAA